MAAACALAFFLVAPVAAAPPAKKRPNYPLTCAGIRVGRTTDADVVGRHGRGVFESEAANLGGRYFVDPQRRVTLETTIGVDRIITAVTYSRGVHIPRALLQRGGVPDKAISQRLTGDLTVDGGTRLGDASAAVIRRYGKPHRDVRKGRTRTIEYSADERTMPQVLFYEAEFRFEDNRLVAVKLYNGE